MCNRLRLAAVFDAVGKCLGGLLFKPLQNAPQRDAADSQLLGGLGFVSAAGGQGGLYSIVF